MPNASRCSRPALSFLPMVCGLRGLARSKSSNFRSRQALSAPDGLEVSSTAPSVQSRYQRQRSCSQFARDEADVTEIRVPPNEVVELVDTPLWPRLASSCALGRRARHGVWQRSSRRRRYPSNPTPGWSVTSHCAGKRHGCALISDLRRLIQQSCENFAGGLISDAEFPKPR
jgi:hypothetical protein